MEKITNWLAKTNCFHSFLKKLWIDLSKLNIICRKRWKKASANFWLQGKLLVLLKNQLEGIILEIENPPQLKVFSNVTYSWRLSFYSIQNHYPTINLLIVHIDVVRSKLFRHQYELVSLTQPVSDLGNEISMLTNSKGNEWSNSGLENAMIW